jgi:uncharacterized membrane protein YphA (DoxX/SURF4 family)
MEILFIAGRLIYGVPLLFMGIRNFWKVDKLTEDARVKGIPAPKVAVIGSTIWLIIGVLAIIFNFPVLFGGIMVAIYLVITGVKIHNFWTVMDPEVREKEMIQLEKNIIIAGAALAIAAASAWD